MLLSWPTLSSSVESAAAEPARQRQQKHGQKGKGEKGDKGKGKSDKGKHDKGKKESKTPRERGRERKENAKTALRRGAGPRDRMCNNLIKMYRDHK